jgi:hypothetical protein
VDAPENMARVDDGIIQTTQPVEEDDDEVDNDKYWIMSRYEESMQNACNCIIVLKQTTNCTFDVIATKLFFY